MRSLQHSGAAVLALILAACAGAPQDASTARPENYHSHCQTLDAQTAGGIFRGLGSGENLQQAKRRAYGDIAEQIQVVVHSDSEALTHKLDSRVSTEWRQRIGAFATATLNDLQLDCLDNGDPTGQVHLALVYDPRSLAVRYAEKIIAELGYRPRRLIVDGPQTLAGSDLINDLRNLVEHPQGDGEISTSAQLNRGANGWQLEIAGQLIPLSEQQLTYSVNWPSLNRTGLDFYAENLHGLRLPLQVANATEYRWRATPSTHGYLQLLGLYQNGEIEILRQDISAQPGSPLTFPESGGVWEAGLIAPGTPTTDTYIALLSPEPLAQTPLASLLHRNRLGEDGSLIRFLLALERMQAAVQVVNLTVLP